MSFKNEIIELGIRVAWRQWSALGVAGLSSDDESKIIDPEALLLLTTVVGRHDPRLFDEVMDWLFANASWINLQRLKTFQKDYTIGESSILAAIAQHLSSCPEHTKWKSLLGLNQPPSEPLRQLFIGVPRSRETEPIFEKHGWTRPPLRLRGMSRFPDINRSDVFIFKLRTLFGRQARSELIAWLLAHENGYPAQIARDLGYSRRAILMVLDEMTLSGHLNVSAHARDKLFSMRKEEWAVLNTGSKTNGFPRWIPYASIFALLSEVLRVVERPDFETISEHLKAIEVNKTMPTNLIARSSLNIARNAKGNAYLASVLDAFKDTLS